MAASPLPPRAIISLLLLASLWDVSPPTTSRQVASVVFDLDGHVERFLPGRRQVEMVGKGQILKWARHKWTRSYGLDRLLSGLNFPAGCASFRGWNVATKRGLKEFPV
jgi:hypothetical protein